MNSILLIILNFQAILSAFWSGFIKTEIEI
jgi:hypothetical protein